MFENQTILITGGTGSWGQTLTRELLPLQPKQIRIFSRGEHAQVNMERAFGHHPKLKFIIGDVRDRSAVREACAGVDLVFHLAALKHVPICESQPNEALKTNVTGTKNIIEASIEQGVQKVIDVSTDKAVDPINLYGMTKAIGEKLMIAANDLPTSTRFVCIRGGNVLGSNGSVVPYFTQLITKGEALTITSTSMTRFFLTLKEAITLLLKAAELAVGGETYVMRMNACRITDLAHSMIEHLATRPIKISEVGIRPGEKLNEVLVSSYEAQFTRKYNDQYFVILPSHPSEALQSRYGELPKVEFSQYDSSTDLMSLDEVTTMLRKGGFLT